MRHHAIQRAIAIGLPGGFLAPTLVDENGESHTVWVYSAIGAGARGRIGYGCTAHGGSFCHGQIALQREPPYTRLG
jgi:hypothetical protein